MKKIAVVSLALLFVVPAALILKPAIGAVSESAGWSAPKAEITCSSISGSGGTPYNVLVVGESWARGSRILPDLQQALSQKLGGRSVHACAIAFSGDNTQKVLRGLKREIKAGHVAHLFDDLPADSVLVLTGVNDQIQHVGSASYARSTAGIAELFPASRVQTVSLPSVRPHLNLAIPLQIKNDLQKLIYDGGKDDVQAGYSNNAAQTDPQVVFVRYQDFMPSFDASRYNRDGIHLTTENFRQYGAFLGNHVDIGSGAKLIASSLPKQLDIPQSTMPPLAPQVKRQ